MFLRDRLSYLDLFVILKFFSRFSGLRVNDDKTELFAIGPQNLVQEEFYHKTCTSIKILGVYFDYHKTTRRNSNFNSILKSINKTFIKEVNKLLYGSIWKRNDKIKCTALINDIEDGGVKMLDIQSMILSQRVIALKRFIEDYNNPWKSILETFLGNIGGKSILYCNFDTRKLLFIYRTSTKSASMRGLM